MNERRQWEKVRRLTTKKREELQKTEEGIEKRAETRPRRNTGQHMRRDHGIERTGGYAFDAHEAKEISWENIMGFKILTSKNLKGI